MFKELQVSVTWQYFIQCSTRSNSKDLGDAMTNGMVYEGLFFNLNMSFFFPLTLPENYISRWFILDQVLKAWPKTRSGILVFWEKGWKAMPQGEGVDHPKKQVLVEVNLRCWTAVLDLERSGKADLITNFLVFWYRHAKGAGHSSLCKKDFSCDCLYLLHLSLLYECIYSFWKLLFLEPWRQALRAS